MNPDTLEPLLRDRALGELTPEVAALLDAYLAQNPSAAVQAMTIDATIAQARAAVAVRPALRAPDLARWRAAAPPRWQIRIRREWAPLAACLVLGGLAGWAVATRRSAPAPESTHARSRAELQVAAVSPAVRPARSAAPFVSIDSLAAERRSPAGAVRSAGRYRLVWDSPIKMPRVEENP